MKFDNGILICWSNVSYTGLRNTSMDCGGYRTSGYTVNLPYTFISTPSVAITDTSSTNYSNGVRAISISSLNKFTCFWWGVSSSSTSTEYTASYIAIGKWK